MPRIDKPWTTALVIGERRKSASYGPMRQVVAHPGFLIIEVGQQIAGYRFDQIIVEDEAYRQCQLNGQTQAWYRELEYRLKPGSGRVVQL